MSLVSLVSLLSGALHFSVIDAYGWFRDELYYLACGEHLDFGYVDHPPLVALVARATRELCAMPRPTRTSRSRRSRFWASR